MNLADCYRILGLVASADVKAIKAAYRRLARQYHPDVNPGDRRAHAKFIQVSEAYQYLLARVPAPPPPQSPQPEERPPKVTVTRQNDAPPKQRRAPTETPPPPLTEHECKLKWDSYEKLQDLLQKRRYTLALSLAESLAGRFPRDREVRQWQAIAYQQHGRYLVERGQLERARAYLKKALKVDPHNRTLWSEVERDFRRIEQKLS